MWPGSKLFHFSVLYNDKMPLLKFQRFNSLIGRLREEYVKAAYWKSHWEFCFLGFSVLWCSKLQTSWVWGQGRTFSHIQIEQHSARYIAWNDEGLSHLVSSLLLKTIKHCWLLCLFCSLFRYDICNVSS